MACAMDSTTVHDLFGIESICIKGCYLLRSYIWSFWVHSIGNLGVRTIIYGCVNSLVLCQFCTITFISHLICAVPLIKVRLGVILGCPLIFRIDRGSLCREEVVLSLSSWLCWYISATSCRWSVVTAISWRSDTLGISSLLLLHHKVLELVWLVIRYIDSLMHLPFLIHRVSLRSSSRIAQESVWSHHARVVVSSDVTISLLWCSIACSRICPVVVVVWWIWWHHINCI